MESLNQIDQNQHNNDALIDSSTSRLTLLDHSGGNFKKIETTLEARLSYVSPNIIYTEWMNAARIISLLNLNERWFYRIVQELGISSELKVIDGVQLPAYPPYTLPLIEEELSWREHYGALPIFISTKDIAEYSGRSFGWIKNTLTELGISPIVQKDQKGKKAKKYRKTVLTIIRNINMADPLADDWYSIGQICDEYPGIDRSWILKRLEQAGCESQARRSSLTGKTLPHYPAEALQILNKEVALRPKPGADWHTLLTISDITGRSENWVRKRLSNYYELSEIRTDDMGVPRVHYPPQVLSHLVKESQVQYDTPDVGDYISAKNIARRLGHATIWAVQRLEQLGLQPELRKDARGRIGPYYSPRVVEVLRNYEDNEKSIKDKQQLIEALFAIGSLKSKINANKNILKILKNFGEDADKEQMQTVGDNLAILKKEYNKAAHKYYRLAKKNNVDFVA